MTDEANPPNTNDQAVVSSDEEDTGHKSGVRRDRKATVIPDSAYEIGEEVAVMTQVAQGDRRRNVSQIGRVHAKEYNTKGNGWWYSVDGIMLNTSDWHPENKVFGR